MTTVTQNLLNGTATRADVEALVGFDLSKAPARPPIVPVDEDPQLGKALFSSYRFPFQRKFSAAHGNTVGRLLKSGKLLDTDTKALVVIYKGEGPNDPITIYQANGAHRSFAHHKFGLTRTYDYRIHVVADEVAAGKVYAAYDAGKPRNAAAANLASNGHLIAKYALKGTTVSLLLAASAWVLVDFDPARFGNADNGLRSDWFDKNAHHGITLQKFYDALQKGDISHRKVFHKKTRGQQVPALFIHILEKGTVRQKAALNRLMDELLHVADGTLKTVEGTGLWAMVQAINIPSAAGFRGQRMYAVIRAWELYYSNGALGDTPLMDPITIAHPAI